MKRGIIGIVGGMGPDAGIALSKNVIYQTDAKKDQDHLPQILCSFPGSIPDRTEFLIGKIKTNPAHNIAVILLKMESIGIKYAALACNSAHTPQIFDVIISELKNHKSKIRLFHIIKEVGKFIKKEYTNLNKIGILGTTGTYLTRQYDMLSEFGLTVINISGDEQARLHKAIYHPEYGIKSNAGNVPEETLNIINSSMLSLIKRGAEIIVLGCTELPLVYTEPDYKGIPVIDSSIILARALVEAHSPGRLRSWQPINF